MRDVASNIKYFRKEKKLTQNELAELLFVTRQAISNWETGKTRPDIDSLDAIAKALEIDLMELLYGKEKRGLRKKQKRILTLLCLLLAAVLAGVFILPVVQSCNVGVYSDVLLVLYEILGYGLPMVIGITSGLLIIEMIDTKDEWHIRSIKWTRICRLLCLLLVMTNVLLILQAIVFFALHEVEVENEMLHLQIIYHLFHFVCVNKMWKAIFLYVFPMASGSIMCLLRRKEEREE